MPLPFLTALWRRPLLLSWPAPDAALLPLLPAGLCLDRWQGSAYISLVGIGFADTRVFGLPAYPRRYAQVNLRFYVRRRRDAGCPGPGRGLHPPDCAAIASPPAPPASSTESLSPGIP